MSSTAQSDDRCPEANILHVAMYQSTACDDKVGGRCYRQASSRILWAGGLGIPRALGPVRPAMTIREKTTPSECGAQHAPVAAAAGRPGGPARHRPHTADDKRTTISSAFMS